VRVPSAAQAAQQLELGLSMVAESSGAEWRARALGYVREFVAKVSGPFLAEDIREFAQEHGFDDPPDARAWGVVMQSARREGVVQSFSYAPARSSNGSPKVLWKGCP
jgi:hypothetical protein